jgi:uncharacterized protein (TIGR02145 family)
MLRNHIFDPCNRNCRDMKNHLASFLLTALSSALCGQGALAQEYCPRAGMMPPTVTTAPITDIGSFSATGGGNVTDDGGGTITMRGVVWGTAPAPTVDDGLTDDGTGMGSFTSTLTGLSPDITYYVRAFAANASGIGYGNEVSFSILPPAIPNDPTVPATNCGSATVSRNGTPPSGVIWYWQGTSCGTSTGLGSGASYTAGASGTYYIRAYESSTDLWSSGCGSVSVTVIDVPSQPGTISGSTTVCSGVQQTYSISAVSGATGYTWSYSGGGTPSGTGVSATLTPTSSGTLTVTADNACGSSTQRTLSITVSNATQHTCGTCNVHNPALTYGTMTDQEGNTYKTIIIGTQEWMAENLKTSTYRNGDAILTGLDNSQWQNTTEGAWAHYNNNISFECPYGKLYNWYAVDDPRNLCPVGWHVPTDAEWTVLTDFLGGTSVAGGKMKTTGTTGAGTGLWNGSNTAATNESGFSGVPGGGRNDAGGFNNIGANGYWWSSSAASGSSA